MSEARQMTLVELAMQTGDPFKAMDVCHQLGSVVPEQILVAASEAHNRKHPGKWPVRYENYLGRVRIVARKPGKTIATE